MAWHTTMEGGTTQKCVKYPEKVGFTTILAGGYTTVLSHQARNDWMEIVNSSVEYRAYRTAEQKLLSIQHQQQSSPNDLSWSIVSRELFFHNTEKNLYNFGKNWIKTVTVPVSKPVSKPVPA